jgi:hypothetical protein
MYSGLQKSELRIRRVYPCPKLGLIMIAGIIMGNAKFNMTIGYRSGNRVVKWIRIEAVGVGGKRRIKEAAR